MGFGTSMKYLTGFLGLLIHGGQCWSQTKLNIVALYALTHAKSNLRQWIRD